MKSKTFNYKEYKNCYFEVGNYVYNSQSMFINIKNKEEGDIATATVNMQDYFYTPNTATIKNYSENNGMTKFLQELGIIDEVYSRKECFPNENESEITEICKINFKERKATIISNSGKCEQMVNSLKEMGIEEINIETLNWEKETIDFCQINIEKLKEYSQSFNYEWDI